MHEDAWLAKTPEAALEPELPICDPHHHLWNRPGTRYLPADLLRDAAGHRVVSTVFVECMSGYREGGAPALQPVGETDYVEAVAPASAAGPRICAGIVSYADLCLGDDVAAVLEAHQAASARFRGIRHASGWDASDQVRNSHTNPPRGLLLDAAFRRGFARLVRSGLSFDAWMYHPQLPDLVDLARAFPEASIVLDHVGGPLGIGPYAGRRSEVEEQWRKSIRELAACPGVVVKLGGLTMPIAGHAWHKRDVPPGSEELARVLGPWYRFVIDCFGPGRCMFESNFPVDRASCSYTVLWNAFKRMSADLSPTERAALFHDTAARVYRL